MSIERWKQEQLAEIQKRRTKALRDKGRQPFWKIPEGTTKITLQSVLPTDYNKGQFGPQKLFSIKVKGEEYALGVRETSPLYRRLVQLLATRSVDIEIIRAGTGKDTRYSVK